METLDIPTLFAKYGWQILSNNRIKRPDKGKNSQHCGQYKPNENCVFINSTSGMIPEGRYTPFAFLSWLEFGQYDEKRTKEYLRTHGYELPESEKSIHKKADEKPYFVYEEISDIPFGIKHFTQTRERLRPNGAAHLDGFHNLHELQSLVNSVHSIKSKHDAPAILKGIYKDYYSGENCIQHAPFIAFDVDVKEHENAHLLDKELNQIVFKQLQKLAVLCWRSNSGNGMAGFFHVPQIKEFDHEHRSGHKQKAELIYNFIQNKIEQNTGIKIAFDVAQGKFRQLRFVAEQKEFIPLNEHAPTFRYSQVVPNESENIWNGIKWFDLLPYTNEALLDCIKTYSLATYKNSLVLPFKSPGYSNTLMLDNGLFIKAIGSGQFGQPKHNQPAKHFGSPILCILMYLEQYPNIEYLPVCNKLTDQLWPQGIFNEEVHKLYEQVLLSTDPALTGGNS